jgi:hypothetical protein
MLILMSKEDSHGTRHGALEAQAALKLYRQLLNPIHNPTKPRGIRKTNKTSRNNATAKLSFLSEAFESRVSFLTKVLVLVLVLVSLSTFSLT